ncbi:hypothetical protein HKD37_20G056561 [Glycine soja]
MCEIGNGMRVVVAVRGGVNDSVATWVEQERRSRDKSGSVMRRQRSLEIASPIEHGEVRLCMMMWESMFNAINLSLAIVAFSFALIPGVVMWFCTNGAHNKIIQDINNMVMAKPKKQGGDDAYLCLCPFVIFGFLLVISLMPLRPPFVVTPPWFRTIRPPSVVTPPWSSTRPTRASLLAPTILSLFHGSVGALPSPFALGPFAGGVRSPFHIHFFLFLFSFLHLCATTAVRPLPPWWPHAAGPCTSGVTGSTLVVSTLGVLFST